MSTRDLPGGREVLRRAQRRLRAATGGATLRGTLALVPPFSAMAPSDAVRVAYQVLLGRDPDAGGGAGFAARLARRELTPIGMAEELRGSEEFLQHVRFSGANLGLSVHAGRCQFIRSLPAARRIVDLGGTHRTLDFGALVGNGYPYRFDELVIVDLPSPQRHAIYRSGGERSVVATHLGPVRYAYHSMADLSAFPDGTVDLVYSGQSIEHVTPADAATVMAEAARILRPGGWLCLDTPNARVTRLQQEAFIDPDHKVEYRLEELLALVGTAGFEVTEVKGLNHAGRSLERGVWDAGEVAGNCGVYHAADECYILCVCCRKPG